MVLATFFLGATQQPGYIEKGATISFLKLNEYFDPSYICPKCEILRPEDSRHCYICDRCVQRFDHHCQWMDTCIGVGNHNYFLMFIISMWAFLALNIVICSHMIGAKIDMSEGTPFFQAVVQSVSLSETGLAFMSNLTVIISMTVSIVFMLPVTLLVIVHSKNFMANKTTMNRMKDSNVAGMGIDLQEIKGRDYAQ